MLQYEKIEQCGQKEWTIHQANGREWTIATLITFTYTSSLRRGIRYGSRKSDLDAGIFRGIFDGLRFVELDDSPDRKPNVLHGSSLE